MSSAILIKRGVMMISFIAVFVVTFSFVYLYDAEQYAKKIVCILEYIDEGLTSSKVESEIQAGTFQGTFDRSFLLDYWSDLRTGLLQNNSVFSMMQMSKIKTKKTIGSNIIYNLGGLHENCLNCGCSF